MKQNDICSEFKGLLQEFGELYAEYRSYMFKQFPLYHVYNGLAFKSQTADYNRSIRHFNIEVVKSRRTDLINRAKELEKKIKSCELGTMKSWGAGMNETETILQNLFSVYRHRAMAKAY